MHLVYLFNNLTPPGGLVEDWKFPTTDRLEEAQAYPLAQDFHTWASLPKYLHVDRLVRCKDFPQIIVTAVGSRDLYD